MISVTSAGKMFQTPNAAAFGTFYYLMGCLKGRYSVTVFKQN